MCASVCGVCMCVVCGVCMCMVCMHKVSFLQIVEELRANGVDIYKFPTDDETVAETNVKMNVSNKLWKGGASCNGETLVTMIEYGTVSTKITPLGSFQV